MKKIFLTQGKYALIDDTDFEWLNQWKWSLHSGGYATSNSGKIYMHRLINETPDGLFTDHINQNKLDNRRVNLRTCTKSQNASNRGLDRNNQSGYKGVSWYRRYKKWRAYIYINGKEKHLGYYEDTNQAALAYNKEAIVCFGEFAKLNEVKL